MQKHEPVNLPIHCLENVQRVHSVQNLKRIIDFLKDQGVSQVVHTSISAASATLDRFLV